MIFFRVVMLVDHASSARWRKIWRVGIDNFAPTEVVAAQKFARVPLYESVFRSVLPFPGANYGRVNIDSYIELRWSFVTKNGAASEMGLDIDAVRRD